MIKKVRILEKERHKIQKNRSYEIQDERKEKGGKDTKMKGKTRKTRHELKGERSAKKMPNTNH